MARRMYNGCHTDKFREVAEDIRQQVSDKCRHVTTETVSTQSTDHDGNRCAEDTVVEKPNTVDVDLHRYKCAHCGEVMYYSNAARRFYKQIMEKHYEYIKKAIVGEYEAKINPAQ